MKRIEMHAIFKGNVHGVFFRDTSRRYAREIGVTGTVRNVPDGTVELYAQGSKEQLNGLVERLVKEGPGCVESVEKEFVTPTRNYEDFRIVY